MNDRRGEETVIQSWVDALDRVALRALVLGFLLMAISGTSLWGQQAPMALTLEEAVSLAKTNNPTFLSTQNDQAAANWQVREAYARFIPSLRASMSGTWQEAGSQRFGTVEFNQNTDWLYSGYALNFGMTIDGNSIFGIPNARANSQATAERVNAAEFNLESTVALQYMSVLRAMDGVDVAQRQLDRAGQNFRIVNTRVETGAAAGMEGRQAEVDLGRAEVGLIQAQRDLRQARLLLSEQLGVAVDEDVRFLSEFEVFDPQFDMDELMLLAMEQHPSLRSFRAQESASRAAARQVASSQYFPSLNLSAQLRGQAQEALNDQYILDQALGRANSQVSNCEFSNTLNAGLIGGLPGWPAGGEDCSQFGFSDADRNAALAANRAFPFDFSTIPMTLSASISIPVFTGFTRERQVSEANNAAEDAEHNLRAEELRLRTMVTNTFDNLESAHRVWQAELRNRTLAEEQLLLQQRRYALGASDLLFLMDAQTSMSTAEQAFLNAVYDFHYNLIALEAAVGQPLRTP